MWSLVAYLQRRGPVRARGRHALHGPHTLALQNGLDVVRNGGIRANAVALHERNELRLRQRLRGLRPRHACEARQAA